MATAAMEQVDPERQVPVGPIVLTLNCRNVAKYLTSQNEAIEVLLGAQVRRGGIIIPTMMLYPTRALKDKEMLNDLSDDYPELSKNQLRARLSGYAGWLRRETREMVQRRFRETLPMVDRLTGFNESVAAVKIVILGANAIEEGSILREVLNLVFPQAAFFRVDAPTDTNPHPENGRLRRIWKEPLCPFGHGEMVFDVTVEKYLCDVCYHTHCAQVPSVHCKDCDQVMEFEDGRYICRRDELAFRPPDRWTELALS